MKPNIRTVAAALCCAIVVHASPEAHAQASGRPCVLTSGRAEVRASPDAPWLALAVGAKPPRTGEIRADREPARFCVADGTTVELAAGSSIALTGKSRVAVEGGGTVTAVHVSLHEGEIVIEGDAARWRGPLRLPVLVRGPGGVSALSTGGTMRARVLPARSGLPAGLSAAAYDTDALASVRGPARPLRAGHAVDLRPSDARPALRSLLRAPSWLPDDGVSTTGPLALVAGHAAGVVSLRFSPVTGATAYEAEIARDPRFTDVVARVTPDFARATMTSPPLPPGGYHVRVSARGADDVRGLTSTPQALRVVRIDLPPGAALLDRLVILPENRAFTWDDPTGLEWSRGPAGFAPAPREVGLTGTGLPGSALLRLAGSRSALPLTLAALAMRGEIELGPKTATWPNDEVWMTVRVLSPDGSTLDYEPTMAVTVNLDPVPVRWQRAGGVFRATLPPRTDAGPWVVRVEACNARGKVLGFGALEVIPSRPAPRASLVGR